MTYTLSKGSVPLLISMPHNGEDIPTEVAETMTPNALSVQDTDWHIDRLYDFASQLGAYIIKPKYNRFVIDLNRDPNGIDLYPGANSTELCPTTAFDLSPLYLEGQKPDELEVQRRIETYWQPYHNALENTLTEMKSQFGQAVLLEAHSILSRVPRFFEGQLPDFNFGNANGKSCSQELIDRVLGLDFSPYSMVANGRFKGGFITRHYGKPDKNIHALQLELSQHPYMNETTAEYNNSKAAAVKPKLESLVRCLIESSQQYNQDESC